MVVLSACERSKLHRGATKIPTTDLEHRRSQDRIVLQRVQGSIGFAQWKHLYARADGNLRGNAQKILSVLARVVRHTANDTFLIEQIVVKRRNRAHVDAA